VFIFPPPMRVTSCTHFTLFNFSCECYAARTNSWSSSMYKFSPRAFSLRNQNISIWFLFSSTIKLSLICIANFTRAIVFLFKKILFGSVSARISIKNTLAFDKWPYRSSLKQNFKRIM
jgi:hypothetical protein